MVETWKPIPGWEGYYEVSDQGGVRSLDRKILSSAGTEQVYRGRAIQPYSDKKGYQIVRLSKNGFKTHKRVHRLVLEAFTGPAPEGLVCCHNDGKASNNALVNLRWDSPSENNRDKVRHGTCHESKKTHCPRGHIFIPQNLAPWHRKGRTCLACARARSFCKKYGLMDRFEEYADKYFEALIPQEEVA